MSGWSLAAFVPSLRGPKAILVAVLLLAAIAALGIDLSLQRLATATQPPGFVRDYFNATEAFGNGFGVAMIVLAVVVLDRTRRVQTGRLLVASLGAGIAADVIKLTIARTRPKATDIEGLLASGASALDTFVGFMPLVSMGSGGQSFPSAHTATAFGLAAVLAYAYPGGARLFYSFAVGVAIQRVGVGAHYLSDVLAGATVGIVWGHAVCYSGAMARRFDRLEIWWSGRFGWALPAGHPGLAVEEDHEEEADVVAMPQRPTAEPAPLRRAA